jgi:probable F420-dependent oxidoreductase
MKYGLAVSGKGNVKLLERMALRAEELGYDSFLVTDHFLLPDSNSHLDVWSFLPYLAAKTEKIRLGTCVTPIPFRHPAILAKSISTCDQLSNGRIILGAGVGWHRPEFDGFSRWLETKDRITCTKEGLEIMRRLWTESAPLNFDGKFIHVKGAIIEPKPIQKPHPPIWLGGHLPGSLRMAGRYAQGWMPIGPRWFDESYPRPKQYSQMRETIIQELKKKRISEKDFTFTNLISPAPDIQTVRSDVEQYIDAGMNYFILGEKAQSDKSLQTIETVAKEIGQSL